jgi:hypothetical protein
VPQQSRSACPEGKKGPMVFLLTIYDIQHPIYPWQNPLLKAMTIQNKYVNRPFFMNNPGQLKIISTLNKKRVIFRF